MGAISTSDFRGRLKIEWEGVPYMIVSAQFVKPGKGVAFVKTRMKNLLTGNVQERNFRSGDKVETPDIDEKTLQYMYKDGSDYHFMDKNTYDQLSLTAEAIGDQWIYLKEQTDCQVMFYKGKPIDIELPNFVILKVTDTMPAVRGDTVSGATKEAVVETGGKMKVPLFINNGDMLRIDTRTGEYVDRVKE
jgi:elongation factor P